MSPRDVEGLAQSLVRRVARTERDLRALQNKNDLGYSSIEDNRSLDVYSTEATPTASFGGQFDGSSGAFSLTDPKPPEPTAPVCVGGLTAVIHWDGHFAANFMTVAPMGFSHVAIHASQDPNFDPMDAATLRDTFTTARGGEKTISLTPGTWYVRLICWTIAGSYSPASVAGTVTVETPADPQAISDALAQFDLDMAAMESDLAANTTALTEAQGRITTAETDLDTAFGQISTAQTTANTAKTDAATAQAAADKANSLAIAAAKNAVDMIANGSFEHDREGYTGTPGSSVMDTTKARTGGKSWKTTGSGELIQPGFPVTAGDTWRYEWYYQTEAAYSTSSPGGLRLQKSTDGGVTFSDAASTGLAPDKSVWTYQKVEYVIPEGVTHIRARAAFAYSGGAAAWMDDLRLINVTDIKALEKAAAAAQTAANSAQTTANSAQTAASTAQTTADNAASAASTAQSTADTAKSDAASAAGIAGGKADVLIQSAAPAADMQKATTLWIDTTNGENKPKRWSESAWTVVTDKAATDAATAAATAQTAANNAQTTANTAKNDAATAQTAANNAQSTANTAKTNAATAQTTADNAATAASTAQGTANTAKNDAATAAGIAGGKADVLIQSTTPAAAMQKATTLWIDTTSGGNKPKRWSGSEWATVTDKAAIDAASAAAAAQTAANNAATAAATAQGTANAAQTAAGNAQNTANTALASANGKTKVYRDTAAPSGSGTTIGDVWWRYADTTWTRVIGEWFWSGTTTGWQKRSLSHETISSVDLGTLTVIGQSTLADVVALEMSVQIAKVIELDVERLRVTGTSQLNDAVANSIVTKYFATRKLSANLVMIGESGNYIANGNGEKGDNSGWASKLIREVADKPATVPAAFKSTAGQGTVTPDPINFTVEPNTDYVMEYWLKADKPNSKFFMELRDQANNLVGGTALDSSLPWAGNSSYVVSDHLMPTTWTKYRGIVRTSGTTTTLRVGALYFNHLNGTERTAIQSIAGLSLKPRLDGMLIADTIYGKTLLGTRVATADTGGRIEMNGTLGEDKLFGVNDLGKTFFDMNPTTGLTMPIDESGGNISLQLGAPLNEGNWNGTTGVLGGIPVLAVRQPGIPYYRSPRIFSYEDGRAWDIRGGNIGVDQIEARLGIGRSVTAYSNSSSLEITPDFVQMGYTFQDKIQIDGTGLHLSSAKVDVNGYRIDEGVGSYKRVTTFANGWGNYPGYNPLIQYFTKPGIAALSGMLDPGTSYAHDVHIATLDPEFRPNTKQYLPFNSNFGGGTNTNYYPGVITIESNGVVRIRGIRGGGGYAVVSVEYPVTPV